MNINIDYLTVSLAEHKINTETSTLFVHDLFASILPCIYKNTCRDMIVSSGDSMRITQYGICVSLQYGSALSRGWVYSVQLSGDYWSAIERNREVVLNILNDFEDWRISRLDLEKTVLVSLDDFRGFCKTAFDAGYNVTGTGDARTAYFGSRKAQFFTRIYSKTANDPKHYTAPDGMAQVRFEVEIHRVSGELVLDPAFLNPEFAEKLFTQRLRRVAETDSTGFLTRYFDRGEAIQKIRTVKRVVGNLEDTVNYVFRVYAPYIEAGLKSKAIQEKYMGKASIGRKAKKILAVLEHGEVKAGDCRA